MSTIVARAGPVLASRARSAAKLLSVGDEQDRAATSPGARVGRSEHCRADSSAVASNGTAATTRRFTRGVRVAWTQVIALVEASNVDTSTVGITSKGTVVVAVSYHGAVSFAGATAASSTEAGSFLAVAESDATRRDLGAPSAVVGGGRSGGTGGGPAEGPERLRPDGGALEPRGRPALVAESGRLLRRRRAGLPRRVARDRRRLARRPRRRVLFGTTDFGAGTVTTRGGLDGFVVAGTP